VNRHNESETPKRGAVRVVNLRPIITNEGDLIVAGTKGTLLGWVDSKMNEEASFRGDPRALVNVAWDDYMFVDSGSTEDPPKPCTLSARGLFIWHTEVCNLRRV